MVPQHIEGAHGRAWEVAELERRDFSDLHKLYWACIMEQNRVQTRRREAKRKRAGRVVDYATARSKTVSIPISYHSSCSPDEIQLSLADMIAWTA